MPLEASASRADSAMMKPPAELMLRSILSSFTTRFLRTSVILNRMSSVRTATCGMMKRSAEELLRSLSCHSTIDSIWGVRYERTTRARPETFSDSMGFFFCAMVDEPTCLRASNASCTSPISERCRFLTSVAYRSHDVTIRPSTNTISA